MNAVRWATFGFAVCVLLAVRPAHAWTDSAHRVVLLSTEGETNPVALELTARLRGELVAASLDVVVVPAAAAIELRTAVETAATELDPAAVIAVRYIPPITTEEDAGADVWISDRLSRTTLMQVTHVAASEGTRAARLAVSIAEILRARLSLPWLEPTPVEPSKRQDPEPIVLAAPAPEPTLDAAPETPSAARHVSAGLGAGFSHYFKDGISNWFPALQLGYEPGSFGWGRAWLRLSATWTPQEDRIQSAKGSLTAREATLMLQGLLRFAPSAPLQPFLSVGIGAINLRLQGQTEAPYEAFTQSTWSGANTFGGGLWIEPREGVAWVLEGQALAAWAPTHARIDGVTVGRWDFPALFVSASLLARY